MLFWIPLTFIVWVKQIFLYVRFEMTGVSKSKFSCWVNYPFKLHDAFKIHNLLTKIVNYSEAIQMGNTTSS